MSYRSERKIKVDISRVFNKAYDDRRVRNALRPVISDPEFKRNFGLSLIDLIVERTESGQDKKGSRFAPYSKAYKNSLTFKVYGKSNRVDLKLTGDMLSSLTSKNNHGPYVTLEFDDEESAAKATGHITGQLGHAKAPIRDFFGISDDEMIPILKQEIKAIRSGSLDMLADAGIPTLPSILFGGGDDS